MPAALPSRALGLLEPFCSHCTENWKYLGVYILADGRCPKTDGCRSTSLAPLLQTGIVVRCHLDARVPLRDLPSERLLHETTPVLAFSPFSNLFPTLLPVFLEAFLEIICK